MGIINIDITNKIPARVKILLFLNSPKSNNKNYQYIIKKETGLTQKSVSKGVHYLRELKLLTFENYKKGNQPIPILLTEKGKEIAIIIHKIKQDFNNYSQTN